MEAYEKKLAKQLVLDELFDLSLYRELSRFAKGDLLGVLNMLIPVEERHFAFWQDFFDIHVSRLDFGRRVKLQAVVLFSKLFGEAGMHLVLEAIEIYGIRKYLRVWEIYKDTPLGGAVRDVLEDEFQHEDAIVTKEIKRRIHPERIRDVFLGFNDGLVEMLGAVSGFFAAFQAISSVLVAGLTVAVAGSISMAAGVFVAVGSEQEVEDMEVKKKRFLGVEVEDDFGPRSFNSAAVVGVSYFIGALLPISPVLFGATTLGFSIIIAAFVIIIVSYILAFLSGMNVSRRIAINLVIIAVAVSVTYTIGTVVKNVFGINI